MAFKIEFETDNAAFDDHAEREVATILRGIVARVCSCERDGRVRDSNGNTIGSWSYDRG